MSTTLTRLPRFSPSHGLGVPARHQQPSAVDVLGVARVGRGGDALRPPPLGGLVAGVPPEPVVDRRSRDACLLGLPVEVGERSRDPDPAPEPLDGLVDVGHVLVGTPQVDARRRVRAHRSNVDGPSTLAACVRWPERWWVSRSSRRVACSRPVGPTRPRWPVSGSSRAARSRRGSPSRRPRSGRSPRSSGCTVEVTGSPGRHLADRRRPRAARRPRRLAGGDPVPHEHDAVRWLRADELDEVTWAEADVPFLDPLRDLMGSR